MADFNLGPLRPADSWSTTEVRSTSHSHTWTIRGFSQCDCRYLETSVRVKDHKEQVPAPMAPVMGGPMVPGTSTVDSGIVFRVRLHPQGNKESNKDFSFFQVFCNQSNAKFRAKFAVYNCRMEEIPTTVYTGTQQLHGYFEYIRRDQLISHVAPQDELQLSLNLTVTFDTVTKSSQANRLPSSPSIQPKFEEVSRDLESLFQNDQLHKDFIFDVEGKEIAVHKAVISCRSHVFRAMLEPHTEEARTGRVLLKDVDYDVMYELVNYIYTGKPSSLDKLAHEVLAAADRFGLGGLKDMAEQHLRSALSIDTAARNLLIGDMHHAGDLRRDSLQYMAHNIQNVMNTEGWSDLLENKKDLVNEIIMAVVNEKNSYTSAAIPGDAPSAKRPRLDGTA